MLTKYFTELHSHTRESSSCSIIKAKTLVRWYKRKGYSAIVVTNHCSKREIDKLKGKTWKGKVNHMVEGFEQARFYGEKIELTVLFGIEITLVETDSDYLVYGADKSFLEENKNIHLYTLKELYDTCKKYKCLLVQAHPFRDGIQLAPLDCIDGIEVFNGAYLENSRNDLAFDYAKDSGKILTSGSDIHSILDLARGGIETTKKITNNEELMQTLKSKDFKIKK